MKGLHACRAPVVNFRSPFRKCACPYRNGVSNLQDNAPWRPSIPLWRTCSKRRAIGMGTVLEISGSTHCIQASFLGSWWSEGRRDALSGAGGESMRSNFHRGHHIGEFSISVGMSFDGSKALKPGCDDCADVKLNIGLGCASWQTRSPGRLHALVTLGAHAAALDSGRFGPHLLFVNPSCTSSKLPVRTSEKQRHTRARHSVIAFGRDFRTACHSFHARRLDLPLV